MPLLPWKRPKTRQSEPGDSAEMCYASTETPRAASTEHTGDETPYLTVTQVAGAPPRGATLWRHCGIILVVVIGAQLLVATFILVGLATSSSTATNVAKPSNSDSGYAGANNSSSPRTEAYTETSLRTAPDQVAAWLVELSHAKTLHIAINSTRHANIYVALEGIVYPTASAAYLFDSTFTYVATNAWANTEGYQQERSNVVLVKNKGYEWVTASNGTLLRTGCLTRRQMPPLNLLRELPRTAVWNADHTAVAVRFAGEVYMIQNQRASEDQPTALTAMSDDLIVQITAMKSHSQSDWSQDTMMLDNATSCPQLWPIPLGVEVQHQEQLPLKGFYPVTLADDPQSGVCGNDSDSTHEKKNCLFVHGLGVYDDVGVVDAYPEYWGDIQSILPCCAVVRFTHWNTMEAPWYSEQLSKRVCDAMVSAATNQSFSLANTNSSTRDYTIHSGSTSSTPESVVVENLVVIAHSMGNLHLTAAFLYEFCQLDPSSSQWLAIQGPMRGTNTANRVLEDCRVREDRWNPVVNALVHRLGLCPVENATQSIVLANSTVSSQCQDELYDHALRVYHSKATASMCGTSPFGLTSVNSAEYVALAEYSNHSSGENDGVVVWHSCAVPSRQYEESYRKRFYRAAINHADGRLVNGDGAWGDNRKPVKWVQQQTCRCVKE